MLEEGRITVEDTWGKVTASQPRLNKFFGQRPTLIPVSKQGAITSGAGNAVLKDKLDHTSGEHQRDARETKTLSEEVAYTDSADITGVPPDDPPVHDDEDGCDADSTSSLPERSSMNDTLRALLPCVPKALLTGRNSGTSWPSQRPSPVNGQTSALAELEPSQINVRSAAVAAATPKRVDDAQSKLVRDFPTPVFTTPHSERRSEASTRQIEGAQSPRRSQPSSQQQQQQQQRHSGHSPRRTAGLTDERSSQNSTGSAYEARIDPGASRVKLWGSLPGARGAAENPRLEDVVEEEDFTDGIDDETFLMLCATQKPVPLQGDCTTHNTVRRADHPLLCREPHDDARSKYNVPTAAVTSEEGPATTCSSHLKQDLSNSIYRTKNAPRAQAAADNERRPAPPMSQGPSESFSAVFDEIEEDDLIALAEKVEADIAASQALSQGTEILTTPSPRPEPKPKTQRRTLPWDDFGAGPGSSTQALMLELVEKAEAAIVGHK
jgi:hypothetical protein